MIILLSWTVFVIVRNRSISSYGEFTTKMFLIDHTFIDGPSYNLSRLPKKKLVYMSSLLSVMLINPLCRIGILTLTQVQKDEPRHEMYGEDLITSIKSIIRGL